MRGLESLTTEPPQRLAAAPVALDGNLVVIAVGVLFLILIAVAVGMSMDTERQHHAADAAANEIRELNEKRRELIELNHRISKAIRVLTDRYQMLKQESSAVERCARCPYRKKDPNG